MTAVRNSKAAKPPPKQKKSVATAVTGIYSAFELPAELGVAATVLDVNFIVNAKAIVARQSGEKESKRKYVPQVITGLASFVIPRAGIEIYGETAETADELKRLVTAEETVAMVAVAVSSCGPWTLEPHPPPPGAVTAVHFIDVAAAVKVQEHLHEKHPGLSARAVSGAIASPTPSKVAQARVQRIMPKAFGTIATDSVSSLLRRCSTAPLPLPGIASELCSCSLSPKLPRVVIAAVPSAGALVAFSSPTMVLADIAAGLQKKPGSPVGAAASRWTNRIGGAAPPWLMGGRVTPTALAHCPYFCGGPFGVSTMVSESWRGAVADGDDSDVDEADDIDPASPQARPRGIRITEMTPAGPEARLSDSVVRASTYVAVGTLNDGVILLHAEFTFDEKAATPAGVFAAAFTPVSVFTPSVAESRCFPIVSVSVFSEYNTSLCAALREGGMRFPLQMMFGGFEQRAHVVVDLHSATSCGMPLWSMPRQPLGNLAVGPAQLLTFNSTAPSPSLEQVSDVCLGHTVRVKHHLRIPPGASDAAAPLLLSKEFVRFREQSNSAAARSRIWLMAADEAGNVALVSERTRAFAVHSAWGYSSERTAAAFYGVAADADDLPAKAARKEDQHDRPVPPTAATRPCFHERSVMFASLAPSWECEWGASQRLRLTPKEHQRAADLHAFVVSHGSLIHHLAMNVAQQAASAKE